MLAKGKNSVLHKLKHEFFEYLVNFAYMSLIFSAIIMYRRLSLSQYGIELNDYFYGVIKAFVIAKVVMIGAIWKGSRQFEHKALVIPILYKALLFTMMVMVFDMIEVFIHGLVIEKSLTLAFQVGINKISSAWLAASLLVFFIFIPFFAVKELIRLMGKDKVQALFFKKHHEI